MERSDGVDVSPHCQRCGSTNTKFCYYNNYSLTQPRYFCKGCRRYWTKGGSLRNVPVGGGCRKSRRGRPISISRYPAKDLDASCVTGDTLFGSVRSSSAPIIDLAAVYANFLKHESKQEPEPAKNLTKAHQDFNVELRDVQTSTTTGPSIPEPQWDDCMPMKNCEEMRDPTAIFDVTTPFELPPLPNEDGLMFPHTDEWFGSHLVGSNGAPPVYRLPDEFSHESHDINQRVDNWTSFDFPI